MTEKFNIEDSDEIIKAEVERFLLLFEKTFKEYQQQNLEEENLDSEDGILTDFLTKVEKKSESTFYQILKVVKQQSS